MLDRRETILLQIMTVLQQAGQIGGVVVDPDTGEQSVFRDRAEVPPDKLPALVLLDGKEMIRGSTSTSRAISKGDATGILPGMVVPTVMTLEPQIFVVLKPRDTIDNPDVGPELSRWRMLLLRLILFDDNLNTMVGSNGEIRYIGHDTDMQTGSTVQGQMQMHFTFSYLLNPGDL